MGKRLRESSAGDFAWSGPAIPDSSFVGRKSQLVRLGAALEKAKNGWGSVLMLSGEAGVGKTRLSLEFAEHARLSGAKVLEGRAHHRVRIPFGVWNQILSNKLSQDSARRIDDGVDRSTVVDPQPLVPFQRDAQISEGESLEAAGRMLIDDARVRPLVLLLDDLHAADPLSLDAFRIFARELSSLGSIVIGIYRDSEINRFEKFGELLGDPIVRDGERILLEGFDDSEIREFVETRFAKTVDPKLLTSLVKLTGGNPRLLDVAVRLNLLGEESLPLGARIRTLLRAEIESHLEPLSPEVRHVLAVACVIGVECELSLLAHVANRSSTELLDALSEAEQAGLVMRTRPGRFSFRQSLIREALYEDLSGAQRARLHLQIGAVLEDLHSHDDEYLSRIAHHFFEAAMVGGVKKAVVYCRRAAEFAVLCGQSKDAAGLYEMAISALEVQRSEDPSERRELSLRLKEVLAAKEQSREGTDAISRDGVGPEAELALKAKPVRSESSIASPTPAPPASILEKSSTLPLESSPRKVPVAADEVDNVFHRESDFWTLKFEGQVLRLRHGKGLVFVAYLLKHPDQEVHVIQLTNLLAGLHPVESVYLPRSERQRLGMHTAKGADSSPLLDSSAKAAYRLRMKELRDELHEAKSFNDVGRVEKATEELEFLEAEISRAVGLGGRERKHATETQRARVNVANAIRALTTKIAKEHPSLARYLRLTIHTGYFCSYSPDPRSAPSWQF